MAHKQLNSFATRKCDCICRRQERKRILTQFEARTFRTFHTPRPSLISSGVF